MTRSFYMYIETDQTEPDGLDYMGEYGDTPDEAEISIAQCKAEDDDEDLNYWDKLKLVRVTITVEEVPRPVPPDGAASSEAKQK